MRLYLLALCGVLTISPLGAAFAASPIDQIRSASRLPALDLEKLKHGEVAGVRGPLGSFPRGVYVESCFFVRAPLPTVGETLLHWDTSKHPEFEISLLREYSWPAPVNTFDSLALSSNHPKDKWLIDHTCLTLTSGKPGELFITANETADARLNGASLNQRDAKVIEFWKKILASRDKALAAGGLNALPHFSAAYIDMSIRAELDGLMKLAPKVAAHFQPLLGARPFAGDGNPADVIVPYWQENLVRGHTTVHNGFLCAQKRSTSWQLADCTYFTSDTYFMSITLYELFPVENGTVVWQIDFVSAPFRSYLGGADRFFAGKEMVKESAKAIQLFRRDVEK